MPNWLVSRRPHADENKEERKTVRNAENGKIGNAENAENAQCGREKMKKENTKKKYEDAERETVRSAKIGNADNDRNAKIGNAKIGNANNAGRVKRQPERAKRRRRRVGATARVKDK